MFPKDRDPKLKNCSTWSFPSPGWHLMPKRCGFFRGPSADKRQSQPQSDHNLTNPLTFDEIRMNWRKGSVCTKDSKFENWNDRSWHSPLSGLRISRNQARISVMREANCSWRISRLLRQPIDLGMSRRRIELRGREGGGARFYTLPSAIPPTYSYWVCIRMYFVLYQYIVYGTVVAS